MTPFAHMGPELFDRPWWWGVGWFLPLLLVAALTGLVVWAVMRSSRPVAASAPLSGPLPAAPPPATAVPIGGSVAAQAPGTQPAGIDPALEAARMRYASGEMTRDEFLRVSRDLGSPTMTTDAEEGDPDA